MTGSPERTDPTGRRILATLKFLPVPKSAWIVLADTNADLTILSSDHPGIPTEAVIHDPTLLGPTAGRVDLSVEDVGRRIYLSLYETGGVRIYWPTRGTEAQAL